MNVLLIEDEIPAAEKLERYLNRIDSNINILERCTSIKSSVSWLSKNDTELDLIFMDIQLKDGISFEIFPQVNIEAPIIFTTAFDEYAIDAFKVNGIDYLLKPITFTDLQNALKKFAQLKSTFNSRSHSDKIIEVAETLSQKKIKDRFLVKLGNYIHSIKSSDVAYFFADGRTVYLITQENKKFVIDYKLRHLEDIISNERFFRVNRSFIMSFQNIENVAVYSNSRLSITSKVNCSDEIIVSRERVGEFKAWLDR